MTLMTKVPTLDEYWQQLEPHLPPFSPEERRVALALYREVAKGEPVDEAQLGRISGISGEETRAILRRDSIECLVYRDKRGRILGFGGLAAAPMHHRFEIDGRVLSTWCAWDSVFIPEILGRPARVASPDPESGELVRLVVTPDRIVSVEPDDAVVSFIMPDAQAFGSSNANVITKFCHFIFFFSSPSSGERWVAKHPDTFLCSVDDAFVLAKRLNARNFGPELARYAQSQTDAKHIRW
jgi:alkylmercury lyase